MCWSKRVSMITFIVAILGSIYLYKRNRPNDRWVAVFAATIGMIQLAEFFMWSDLGCGSVNKYASMFALFILALEPLMSMIGGLYFSDTSRKAILRIMLFIYVLFIVYVFFAYVYRKQITWCGTNTCGDISNEITGFFNPKACNLRWFFMDNFINIIGIIWTVFLLIPFLAMTPTIQGAILMSIGLITFVIAAYANTAAQGSLWCWFAIIIIFYKILVP